MSETKSSEGKSRKVVGRNIAIALGIACIILIAGIGGAMAYYTMTTNDKNTTISNRDAQISDLQNQNNQLQAWLTANVTEYQNYVSSHNFTSSDYTSLQSAYNSLQTNYNEYVNSHIYSNSEYEGTQNALSNYVNAHGYSNSEYDSLQSTYYAYVANHHYTDADYILLQSIANMGQQQSILSQFTVNQGSGTHSLVTSFQANYAGYLDLSLTSTTSNAYVIVEYWYQGRLFSVSKTLGTSGEAIFCLLPASVAIYAGNTNLLNGATHTITATYYY